MFRDADFREVLADGSFQTDAGRDYTVKVLATGLPAGAELFYRFTCEGQESPIGRTRTLPTGHLERLGIAVLHNRSVVLRRGAEELCLAGVDDLLLGEHGIVPFGLERATHALMGRFGNTMLVNGETDYRLEVRHDEVVRFYFTNVTCRSRNSQSRDAGSFSFSPVNPKSQKKRSRAPAWITSTSASSS